VVQIFLTYKRRLNILHDTKRKFLSISISIKNRNFTNPDDKKCQANISRRIKTALGKLPADFAQYLKDTITTDNYGRIYRGAERWE